jgi:hypothetical protein
MVQLGRTRGTIATGWVAALSLSALLVTACAAPSVPATSSPVAPTSPPTSPAAPGAPGASGLPSLTGSIRWCADVPRVEAAPELYRDEPIYVANEMPAEAVQRWARGKPGFEGIWIDRERNGWVTVAFSRDAAARQAELDEEFPGAGVVAAEVDWTISDLEALADEVIREDQPAAMGVSARVNYGVVGINVGILTQETVAAFEDRYEGERVCFEGIDPASLPPEGPQLPGGDTWRLLADQDEVGPPYRTGIAAAPDAYAVLWAAIGLEGEPPAVDFESEVVVWFGAVHGSSCPRLRLDGVVADHERALLYAEITRFELGGCTADAIGHAYIVAVPRNILPNGPFTIQLQSEEPPPGAIEEKTIVETDLSRPGSTLGPDDLHSAPPPDGEGPRVTSGGVIEPDVAWRYRLNVHCGVEWLGELNSVWWRTDAAGGGSVPPEWEGAVELDGTIDLEIVMSVEPPRIRASAEDHTVTYRPSAEDGPTCR